jgi:hypothetical protein
LLALVKAQPLSAVTGLHLTSATNGYPRLAAGVGGHAWPTPCSRSRLRYRMNSRLNNRLILVDRGSEVSDTLDIFDADSRQLLFKSSEPKLERLSKVFRFIGGAYGKMAGIDYSICHAASAQPVLRVFRAGRMIGPTPPFELFDGTGGLLARFNRRFSLIRKRWRFKNDWNQKLFDMSVKQRLGFALSAKSLSFDILIDDLPFASIVPYKDEGGMKFDGKRARLLEFSPSTESEQDRRLLMLGVGASLDRIIQTSA